MSAAPAIDVVIDDLHKSFGPQKVLDGVSFRVEPGEVFALMGPSGSGKSVLLRHVIGLMEPDKGAVRIAGKDASDPATHEQIKTAMVFQAGALFNSMTVFDNLALYPREHRLYREAEIREKVNETLRILSIENAAQKIPAELSGGMKKRVAVARAIMMEPQLLLYDEPTSELDPITAATVSELIATVQKETGVTSLVVTHDTRLTAAIADHAALLFDGRLAFAGTGEELVNCPDPHVRDFLEPTIDPSQPRFRQTT